jgi:hypothetical protein
MGERSRQVGKRIGCAVIASAVAVTLGLSVHHGLQTTAAALGPAMSDRQTTLFQQEECLYQAIRSMVPKGATVYVDIPYWPLMQKLTELSTLWAVPQPSLATAQYKLSAVSAHGDCSGIALEVRRP